MPDDNAAKPGTDRTLTPSQAIALDATSAATDADAPRSASTGTLPDRYQLTGMQLGAGGMGEVLLAKDDQIGREVAIKRMLSTSAEGRFLREARIQGRLDHPAIVPVHELSRDSEGRPFFVMKRLAGTTLAEVIARKDARYPRQKLLRAFADVCLAVEFAHQRNVVHRDLKPANIMLGDFGEVYVLDWGIARTVDELDEPRTLQPAPRGDVTEAGAILGTPGYLSPEQLTGQTLDGRADVFALGCILFEILAGQSLFAHGREGLAAVLTDFDARPSVRRADHDVPPELDAICVDATRRAASDRLASARELANRVERFLDGDRDLAKRKSLADEHVSRARAALANGDSETARAAAMREAGRAIALDPSSADAAELVGRLMLEAPATAPREVDIRLDDSDRHAARRKAMLTSIIYFSYLGFIPFMLWMGIRDVRWVAVYVAAVVVNASLAFYVGRRKAEPTLGAVYVTALSNAVLIAIMSRMFVPFLVAPGIAAINIILFCIDTRLRLSVMLPMMIVATLGPWVLEFTGLIEPTMYQRAGELVMHAPSVIANMPSTQIALATYCASLIILSGFVAKQVGATQRGTLQSVELQAWHLRQLVKRDEPRAA